jgi:hypothetical protein
MRALSFDIFPFHAYCPLKQSSVIAHVLAVPVLVHVGVTAAAVPCTRYADPMPAVVPLTKFPVSIIANPVSILYVPAM